MSQVKHRTRLCVFVEREQARRVSELSVLHRRSKSSVVATALTSFLSPEGLDRREVAIVKRLDRLVSQFERLERDQTILMETLALFIRYQLSVSSSIPESSQEARRAQGKARFEKFIEQLARHLERGGSLSKQVYREIFPEDPHLKDAPQANSSADASKHEERLS